MSRALDTWQGKTDDAAIPDRVRLRIFDRCGGRCQYCTRKVGVGYGPFQYDHIIALINSGRHSEDNLQLLCSSCHADKTAEDVAFKATVARLRAKHLGIKRGPSRISGPGFPRREPQHTATRPVIRKSERSPQ